MAFPTEGDGSLNKVFQNISLDCFPAPKLGKVLRLSKKTSIADACRILIQHNFLCAPVYNDDAPEDSSWMERYVGVVDLLSIVDWMVKDVKGEKPGTLDHLIQLNKDFTTTTIEKLAKHPRWCPFVPVENHTNNLLDVMLLIGKYGVHRVMMVEAGKDITNIITQGAMVGELNRALADPDFVSIYEKAISELGVKMTKEDILTVKKTDSFWHAFEVMGKNLVSAVPVVDGHGKLCGHLSVKDIRSMLSASGQLHAMSSPIESRAKFVKHEVITCKEEDSLGSVIAKLANNKIHRIYIVDNDNKLVGVVALREILALLVKEPSDSTLPQYFSS